MNFQGLLRVKQYDKIIKMNFQELKNIETFEVYIDVALTFEKSQDQNTTSTIAQSEIVR